MLFEMPESTSRVIIFTAAELQSLLFLLLLSWADPALLVSLSRRNLTALIAAYSCDF